MVYGPVKDVKLSSREAYKVRYQDPGLLVCLLFIIIARSIVQSFTS